MLFASYLALLISVVAWVRDVDLRRWPERAPRSTPYGWLPVVAALCVPSTLTLLLLVAAPLLFLLGPGDTEHEPARTVR